MSDHESEIRAIERFDSVRQLVRTEIVRLIVRGTLKPGSNIAERRLSAQLGVSRTPVREALAGLERDGLVYTDHARGFFVQPLTIEEVRETYPILWTLEKLAVDSTESFGGEVLAELEMLNAAMAADSLDPLEAIDLDTRWHRLLVGGCQNNRLVDQIDRLHRAIHRYEIAYMTDQGPMTASVAQHEAIIAALRRDDRAATRELLEENFRISLNYFADQLRRVEDDRVA